MRISARFRPADSLADPPGKRPRVLTQDARNAASNFTILRLLLAVLVVLGHYQLLAGVRSPPWPYSYAATAVDCFFVVSGYLISASFDRDSNLQRFYVRRLFRIYPLYAAVIAAQAVILVLLQPSPAGVSPVALLRYLVANATFANFLQRNLGGDVLSGLPFDTLNPSVWTLKVEFGFYLILPFIWIATERLGWYLLAAIFVASAGYQWGLNHAGYAEYARQLPGQLQFFVLGIAAYRLRDRPALGPRAGWAVAIGSAVALTAMHYNHIPLVYPVVVAILVTVVALKLPPLAIRTDMSFGVYLLHAPLIQLALLLGFYRAGWLPLGVTLVVVLALAWLAERAIETPGVALGRRLSGRIGARVPAASAT